MSLIYSKLTALLNWVTKEFHNSYFFTLILIFFRLIEKQWVKSSFKEFYPDKIGFLEKNTILKNYIFHPLIVLAIFTVFLALSSHRFSKSLTLTLIIAFVFFFIGSCIFPRFFLNNEKFAFEFKRNDAYSVGFCLMIVSFIFFIICIVSIGGIPILNPSLRYLLRPAFTMPVFLIIPATGILACVYLKDYQDNNITKSQIRFRFLSLLMWNILILMVIGYRTPIIASLLILIIIAYYGEVIAVWEVLLGVLLGIVAIAGIGYYRSLEEYGISGSINPFYTLKSRADFTLNVLNLLDIIGKNTGITHGKIISSSIPGSEIGPRRIVGQLIGWRSEVTITPTLIGQMVADFGKVGVAVEMCILGFILGIGYKIMDKTKNFAYIGIYSLILTYTLIGIETGILDIQVLAYFTISLFIYVAYIIKSM